MFTRLAQYSKNKNFRPWLVGIIFGGLILIGSFLMYGRVRDLVATQDVLSPNGFVALSNSLPPITPIPVAAKYFDVTRPLQPEDSPPPQPWDGVSPVTVLLLAGDQPLTGPITPNLDAFFVVRLDPQTRAAGVIAIPSDLWAPTPDGTYHQLYQLLNLTSEKDIPGGEMGLAIATIENLMGMSIPYYVMLDFAAFEQLVAAIEGVKINIDAPYSVMARDRQVATLLDPGAQTLPGNIALAYLRAADRSETPLPDRIDRQKDIIFGMRQRLIDFQLFPTLMATAPEIYAEIAAGLYTNLNLQQAVQFSWLVTQIPAESFRWGRINSEQMLITTDPSGDPIRQPIPDEIFKLRDQILLTQSPLGPAEANTTESVDPISVENAQIEIRNGTQTPGLGAHTEVFLTQNDLTITTVANADQLYTNTTLIFYTGKPYTVAEMVKLLQISPNNVYQRFDPDHEIDILVLLGQDWAAQQQ
jgi:polyisoprenyl-teichoic acid--peptidoglycan teichoic acid transferase